MFIREKYDVNIEMFGNFLFFPGQQIFIHPTFPGKRGQNIRENMFINLGIRWILFYNRN